MIGQRLWVHLKRWVWLCSVFVFVVAGIVWGSLNLVFASSESDKARSRLEELFRWKVSDALLLDPKEEMKFTETLKEISEHRRAAQEKMDSVTQKIAKATVKAEIEGLVKEYESALKDFTTSQHDEVSRLKKLFGPAKFGKYLALKYDVTSKLKSAISTRALATKEEDRKAGNDGK